MQWKKLGDLAQISSRLSLPTTYTELLIVAVITMHNSEQFTIPIYAAKPINTNILAGFYNSSTWAGYIRHVIANDEIILHEASNGSETGSQVSGGNLTLAHSTIYYR